MCCFSSVDPLFLRNPVSRHFLCSDFWWTQVNTGVHSFFIAMRLRSHFGWRRSLFGGWEQQLNNNVPVRMWLWDAECSTIIMRFPGCECAVCVDSSRCVPLSGAVCLIRLPSSRDHAPKELSRAMQNGRGWYWLAPCGA